MQIKQNIHDIPWLPVIRSSSETIWIPNILLERSQLTLKPQPKTLLLSRRLILSWLTCRSLFITRGFSCIILPSSDLSLNSCKFLENMLKGTHAQIFSRSKVKALKIDRLKLKGKPRYSKQKNIYLRKKQYVGDSYPLLSMIKQSCWNLSHIPGW